MRTCHTSFNVVNTHRVPTHTCIECVCCLVFGDIRGLVRHLIGCISAELPSMKEEEEEEKKKKKKKKEEEEEEDWVHSHSTIL